jgi:hypothetical protein
MGSVIFGRSLQNAVRNPYYVVPQRLPLVLLIPYIRALKEWDHEPLGLHENHLR